MCDGMWHVLLLHWMAGEEAHDNMSIHSTCQYRHIPIPCGMGVHVMCMYLCVRCVLLCCVCLVLFLSDVRHMTHDAIGAQYTGRVCTDVYVRM